MAVLVGATAMLTGISALQEIGGDDYTVDGLWWALLGWFALMAGSAWFLERLRRERRLAAAMHSVALVWGPHWERFAAT